MPVRLKTPDVCFWLAKHVGEIVIAVVILYTGGVWPLPCGAQTPWTTNGSNLSVTGYNVGIGTTSPSAPLSIASNTAGVRVNSWVDMNSSVCGLASIGQNVFLNYNSTPTWANTHGSIGGSLIQFGTCYGPAWNDILFLRAAGTTGSIPTTANGGASMSETMRITSTGNVGIGTASPTKLLSVGTVGGAIQAGDNFSAQMSGHGNGRAIFGSNIYYDAGGVLRTVGNHASYGYAGVQPQWGDITFYAAGGATTTDAAITPTPRMIVQGSTGNVGIGTAAPQYKLAVNGTMGAKEVIVTATGWSDYVFKPDYRLKSLKEIAQYIQENHHLPEIPAEAEVQEKGISVGEIQAKLLAKVEELTLHMIQAEERNDRLEDQNRDLRERNRVIQERIGRLEVVADSAPVSGSGKEAKQ
jgi:hypothetical protein